MSRKSTTPDPASRHALPHRLRLRVAVKAMTALLIATVAYLLLSYASSSPPLPRHSALREVALDGIAPGQLEVVEWSGRQVVVLHRGGSLAEEGGPEGRFLVVVGHAVASGCPVIYQPPASHLGAPVEPWPGGFRDPCSGSWYDSAGHSLDSSGADLRVPPHHFPSTHTLIIGEEQP